jgi:capsular polysaccharide export protein
VTKAGANCGASKEVGRNYLLLQMPCGKFGRELQSSLIEAGHQCTRIVFNGGDLIDALGEPFVSYRKSAAEWPSWIEGFAQSHAITDLVCYGDCRPYHCAAIDVLKPLGIRIHVLEEGYLRPNWITCEPNGVNGFSDLTQVDVGKLPDFGEMRPETELPSSFLNYCLLGFLHYAVTFFLRPMFPRYVSHRDLGILTEAGLWLGRWATWPVRRMRLRRLYDTIRTSKKPVHLVLLQLNGDSQIKVHSDFNSIADFIRHCISEFAASGTDDGLLVFKNHPLDNGIISLGKLIRSEADRHGLAGRVLFADGGNLVSLMGSSSTAISINSTACHQALRRGIPTLLVGRAVFNHPQITSNLPMRKFFASHPAKNRAYYDKFIKYMMQTCQINGGFYNREGRQILVPGLVATLTNGRQSVPSQAAPVPQMPPQPVKRDAVASA